MNKTFALAELKALDPNDPTGEFEAILSAPTLDRDGEVIDAKAFEPLPTSIPVHAFHDFADPVGRGVPFYEGDVLKLRGRFATTARAQEIRTLVAEGVIASMSVGFMSAEREMKDGVPHIVRGELLEGSMVSIPSNRESAVLLAKEFAVKVGARNSAKDAASIQSAHDLMVELGATCPMGEEPQTEDADKTAHTDPEEKAAAPAAAIDPPADVLVAQARAEALRVHADLLRN
jgi:HK97 family phage prohead protease